MSELTLKQPLKPLMRLRTDFDRLVDELLGDRWSWIGGENGDQLWTPRLDFSETEKEYVAKMDLPGLEKGDVNVKVENHQLTVSGERKEEKREEGENFLRMERSYGSFFRSIPLPENAKADAIDAQIKNGVLMVRIPKTEGAKAKVIPVK
jgi:HSP20 family protein